jgi:signal transduction histidine kinase
MSFRRVDPNQTLALSRVNILLGRIFSIAAPIIGLQMFLNAIQQIEKHHLNQFWFWLSLGLLLASHLAILITVWFVGNPVYAYQALVLATFFALATWIWQLGDLRLPPGEQPWVWWSAGIGGVAAIGAFRLVIAGLVLVSLPSLWFVIQVSEIGSRVDPLVAFQDSMFAFLFSAVVSACVAVLRYESAKVDEANQATTQASIALATADAVQRERDRIDALVHDSVLTTLLLAAAADSTDQNKEAELLAKAAISKLNAATDPEASGEAISINSLFTALEVAMWRQSESVEISVEGSSDFSVPAEVAAAVTESTLQALANSLQHAGRNVKRKVFLKGVKSGLKIVVKDDGKGFRPARVPKDRLGLRLSIIGRMQSVAGQVHIDSKIGTGTNVVIEWSQK